MVGALAEDEEVGEDGDGVIGIAVGTKSLKVLTIISYIVDAAWVISMIFVLKNLNIF